VVDVITASTGAIGLGPYGDEAEHTGPPEVIVYTPPYREFMAMDARSIMLTLIPHHYNLIPNPSFRADLTGWTVAGLGTSVDPDVSWVGKSVVCDGDGHLKRMVYVGPLQGTEENQWDPKRGGPEATFSVYARGEGEVRLSMVAYYSTDQTDLTAGPQYQNLPTSASPATEPAGAPALLDSTTDRVWTLIDPTPDAAPFYEDIGRGPAIASVTGEWTPVEDDGEWHRNFVHTYARILEEEGLISFVGARWVEVTVEVRNANSLRLSSTMLDPTEYPVCAYFDGGMTEELALDDFLWEGEADDSASYYYFDRVLRAKWLHENIGYAKPAGSPHQIFFGSYWRPYVGATGETVVLPLTYVAGTHYVRSAP
jgi:hypothetical protein